uniref:Fungal lipase-type domain-containing protein n=1 Tax=Erythrolobus australicus TaxID=1077150 RepID=A0A7S1TLZ3_9RHOD
MEEEKMSAVSTDAASEDAEEEIALAECELAKLCNYVSAFRVKEIRPLAPPQCKGKGYVCRIMAKKMERAANDGAEYIEGVDDSDDDGTESQAGSEVSDGLEADFRRASDSYKIPGTRDVPDQRPPEKRKSSMKSIAKFSEAMLGRFPTLAPAKSLTLIKSQKSKAKSESASVLNQSASGVENGDSAPSEADEGLLRRATTFLPRGYDKDEAKLMVEFTTAAYCRVHNSTSYECGCGPQLGDFRYTGRFTDVKLDAAGFTGISPKQQYIVAAFRGTVSAKNWMSNLKAVSMAASKGGGSYVDLPAEIRIHLGFYQHFASIGHAMVDEVLKLHRENPTFTVYVTGHSLGGAMAALAALHLVLQGVPDASMKVYTFGQPRVGNEAFSRYFDERVSSFYRIVNNHDIVPHLPLRSAGFRHVGEEMWFSSELSNVQRKQLVTKNSALRPNLLADIISEHGLMGDCANTTPFSKLGIVDHLLYYDRITGKHRLRGAPPPKRPIKSDGRIEVVSENFAEVVFDPYKNVVVWVYTPKHDCCKNKAPFKKLMQHAIEELELGNDMALKVVQINGVANDLPEHYFPDGISTVYFKPAGSTPYKVVPIKLEGPATFDSLLELVESNWIAPRPDFFMCEMQETMRSVPEKSC